MRSLERDEPRHVCSQTGHWASDCFIPG
ncbi:MAG: hypothetical protein IPP47_03705 [Bryobacterales bacterium]|nr:hypothetical protein [Bryobacterales bacterium]